MRMGNINKRLQKHRKINSKTKQLLQHQPANQWSVLTSTIKFRCTGFSKCSLSPFWPTLTDYCSFLSSSSHLLLRSIYWPTVFNVFLQCSNAFYCSKQIWHLYFPCLVSALFFCPSSSRISTCDSVPQNMTLCNHILCHRACGVLVFVSMRRLSTIPQTN